MRKKIISALLSLSIFVSLLVSCTANQTSSLTAKTFDDNYRMFYEIYVRSYSDSNGDGIGDIQGLISKMDYLHAKPGEDDSMSLGIDAVWLMPIFTSPSEHKYDVTDYYSIDPTYGTMDDFDQMVEEFHARGIKVILDMVVNHSSSQHPWFTQAVDALNKGEESKYINYYNFTQDPRHFGMTEEEIAAEEESAAAETNDQTSAEEEQDALEGFEPVPGNEDGWYYECRFWSGMPDLNLDNPDVIRELKDIMKFWIDKGVDGYRLDACTSYYTWDMEKSIDFLGTVVDYCKSVKPDFYLVGEVWSSSWVISQYYKSGIDSIFNFDCSFVGPYLGLLNNITNNTRGGKLSGRLETVFTDMRNANLDAIDAPFLSNHDHVRAATYLKASSDRKLAASLYQMLPGNGFIYYGEEIGMTEGAKNDSEKRLPIMWSTEENGLDIIPPQGAGHVGSPYFGVYEQLKQPDSLLRHYKQLLNLKRYNPEIQRAQVVSACDIDSYNVAAYTCAYNESAVMVLQNLVATPRVIDLRAAGYENYSEFAGFVIADDYVEEEVRKATVKGYEYEVPEAKAGAAPVIYVDGKLTMPPKSTVVLRCRDKVDSTFVTTTTAPYVSPTDLVTPTDLATPTEPDDSTVSG